MAIQSGVWGIDLGQCALKALRLENGEGGLVATAFDYVEHPKILSQPDADPDQLTREALEKFLSRNSIKGDHVAISVPGQSGLARFVKLPPVEEKKIVDIVRFEAKQQIPFNLEEVVWDYQKLSSGAVADGFAMETEIGLFAMKRDMVNRYLQHFRDVNVEVHLVQMSPLALCNFVSYDLLDPSKPQEGAEEGDGRGKKQCVVALDIGADSSNLVITDGGRIIWQRPIPLGGNHFTRALTKDMKLTFAKAEHLKRNATKSPDLKQILSSLKPVLNDFVGEVQRSLGYFTNTHRDAHVRFMVGLGNAFRLPGLQRFIGEKLQLDVRRLAKLERLSGDSVITAPTFSENILSYGVAYGLALQGLKLSRLQTNLLPPEIQVDRMIKAKKPMAAAAAAVLLLGLTGLATAYGIMGWAYGGSDVEKAKVNGKSAVDRHDALNKKYKTAQDKVTTEENAVRSIIAGRDELPDWVTLHKYIASALPRPTLTDDKDPQADDAKRTNLIGDKAQKLYLNADGRNPAARDKAKQAYERLLARKAGEKNLPGKEEVDDYLIQVNIEAVDARWADDLGVYWSRIKKELGTSEKKENVRPASAWDNAPKDAGWVVEIRGSTNHETPATFLRETFVENLVALGVRDIKPALAGTQSSAATPATDEKKNEGPVTGSISHIVLYKIHEGNETGFDLASELSNVFSGGGSGGKGGIGAFTPPSTLGMGANPSGTDPKAGGGGLLSASRASWKPLTSDAGGRGTGGMYGSGMYGPGSMPKEMVPGTGGAGGMTKEPLPPPPTPGSGRPGSTPVYGPGSGSGPPRPDGVGPETQPKRPGSQRGRTDFVIFLIWKEAIPSDKLRFPAGEPVAPQATTPAAPSMPTSPTPPPSSPPAGGGGGSDEFSIKRGS
jgi:type IV pilus assembly protein PilM